MINHSRSDKYGCALLPFSVVQSPGSAMVAEMVSVVRGTWRTQKLPLLGLFFFFFWEQIWSNTSVQHVKNPARHRTVFSFFCSQTALVVCVLCVRSTDAVIKILTTLIRDNVAGQPVIHEKQHWPFHPDEGARRNPEFEALNGHRAYYLVERLGLGMDGRQAERKYQQMIRDLGVPTTSYEPQQLVFMWNRSKCCQKIVVGIKVELLTEKWIWNLKILERWERMVNFWTSGAICGKGVLILLLTVV